MVKVSIQITKHDSNNKKIVDKIAYINPEATREQLIEFAQMLTALTNDTYTGTTKIIEEDL